MCESGSHVAFWFGRKNSSGRIERRFLRRAVIVYLPRKGLETTASVAQLKTEAQSGECFW